MYIVIDQEDNATFLKTEKELKERLFFIKYGFSYTKGEIRIFEAKEKQVDLLSEIKINKIKGEL